MTGGRQQGSTIFALAIVVMIVNVRCTVLSGHFYPSHSPANSVG
jgi:hypothetical protein